MQSFKVGRGKKFNSIKVKMIYQEKRMTIKYTAFQAQKSHLTYLKKKEKNLNLHVFRKQKNNDRHTEAKYNCQAKLKTIVIIEKKKLYQQQSSKKLFCI